MSIRTAKPEHEVLYQELAKLIGRHADKMTSEEVLAVGAYQDQRTMTRERAMEIIIHNIEMGNQQAIAEVMISRGTA